MQGFSLYGVHNRDYQESVTIGQTDARTHTHTDRRQTKWSLCAAMLRRRHKNRPKWALIAHRGNSVCSKYWRVILLIITSFALDFLSKFITWVLKWTPMSPAKVTHWYMREFSVTRRRSLVYTRYYLVSSTTKTDTLHYSWNLTNVYQMAITPAKPQHAIWKI